MTSNNENKTPTPKKAIVMYSGGADSTLAMQLMLNQGVEVIALNVKTPFCSCSTGGCAGTIGDIILDNNIKTRTVALGQEYMEMIAKPKFGYGKGMNPCSDCRIMMLQAGRKVMEEEGAGFVVTGEVAGQRPNSQKLHQMKIIEKESGLTGRLLRPLSARLLKPTIPEEDGTVDREQLLNLSGRSRKPQKELADKFGLGELPGSGGGCVLAEERYAPKVKDMYDHAVDGFPTEDDASLLRIGRHYRYSPDFKIVVSRDEQENFALERLMRPGDLLFDPGESTKGPLVLARGRVTEADLEKIAAIQLRYCKVNRGERVSIQVLSTDHPPRTVEASPMDPEQAKTYLIAKPI